MTKEYLDEIGLPQFPLWSRLNEKRVPYAFELEITARCNNNCRHCYINLPAGDQEAKKKEISCDDIGSIADQALDLGALWCLINGGEPLLRDDFPEIFTLLKRKGLLISVFTNGCLITDDHIALFKQYPPREIEVSVYGVSKGTYERVTRQPGSYAAFRRGIDLLIENGIRTRLKAMALRSNVHELPEIARFCRHYTADYFRFDPFLHLRYDGDEQRNKEIVSERLSPDEVVAIEQADQERAGSLVQWCNALILPERESEQSDQLFRCGAGTASFTVGYDGYFRLCSSLWHPDCIYDLRKGSLKDAWDTLVPAVRARRSDKPEFLDKCRKCPIINLCLWCPAHAHLETGQMDVWTPYFCEVAHARASAIMKKTGS